LKSTTRKIKSTSKEICEKKKKVSLENQLRNLPIGFLSKKETGHLIIFLSISSWYLLASSRGIELNELDDYQTKSSTTARPKLDQD